MTVTTASISGRAVRAGTYDVDPVHSRIGSAVKHLGINVVRGRFERFAATIEVAEDLAEIGVKGTVEADSVATGFLMRDEHLRTVDPFDVASHPDISFTSTGTTPAGGGSFRVDGEITLRGITRPIVLDIEAIQRP